MVAMICGLPHADHDLWMADDLPKLEGACGLIAARMLSWQTSQGMTMEIAHFKRAVKPIVYPRIHKRLRANLWNPFA
jgi:hypothetical protein